MCPSLCRLCRTTTRGGPSFRSGRGGRPMWAHGDRCTAFASRSPDARRRSGALQLVVLFPPVGPVCQRALRLCGDGANDSNELMSRAGPWLHCAAQQPIRGAARELQAARSRGRNGRDRSRSPPSPGGPRRRLRHRPERDHDAARGAAASGRLPATRWTAVIRERVRREGGGVGDPTLGRRILLLEKGSCTPRSLRPPPIAPPTATGTWRVLARLSVPSRTGRGSAPPVPSKMNARPSLRFCRTPLRRRPPKTLPRLRAPTKTRRRSPPDRFGGPFRRTVSVAASHFVHGGSVQLGKSPNRPGRSSQSRARTSTSRRQPSD